MGRLDIERQKRLEPLRFKLALAKLEDLSCVTVLNTTDTTINFLYKDHNVNYHPYSGWASGKSIKDGRGLNNLLNQLK